jgi:hypothetical protein
MRRAADTHPCVGMVMPVIAVSVIVPPRHRGEVTAPKYQNAAALQQE